MLACLSPLLAFLAQARTGLAQPSPAAVSTSERCATANLPSDLLEQGSDDGKCFTPRQSLTEFPDNPTARITLDGELCVVDACTLELRNLVFFPPLTNVYLYGNDRRISDTAVQGSNNATQTFTLDAGAPLGEVDEINLYSEDRKLVIASVPLGEPTKDDESDGDADEDPDNEARTLKAWDSATAALVLLWVPDIFMTFWS